MHIWNDASNLEHFEKKDEHPSPVISEIIDSERVGYFKRLKGLASEHHSVSNVSTGSRHCSNQHDTTIIVFFHEFEIN